MTFWQVLKNGFFDILMMSLGSGEKKIKCQATDVVPTSERAGEFEWRLGGKVSISSTFYEQLLHAKIPEAQKRQSSCQFF
jgi:hypothetical protein